MSVLIKGMEIPQKPNGAVLILYPDGDCVFENGFHYKAVPVPDHGRLIDADVLRAMCDDPHWCVWMSEIDDSPTIIPADPEEEGE